MDGDLSMTVSYLILIIVIFANKHRINKCCSYLTLFTDLFKGSYLPTNVDRTYWCTGAKIEIIIKAHNFPGPRNFELSHRVCLVLQNFQIVLQNVPEFHRI